MVETIPSFTHPYYLRLLGNSTNEVYLYRAEDSFHYGSQGMLCCLPIMHSNSRDLPKWKAVSWRQWQDVVD